MSAIIRTKCGWQTVETWTPRSLAVRCTAWLERLCHYSLCWMAGCVDNLEMWQWRKTKRSMDQYTDVVATKLRRAAWWFVPTNSDGGYIGWRSNVEL